MSIKLRVYEPGRKTWTAELSGPRLIVGRTRECDLPLAHHAISRRHAEIVFAANGECQLADLDSRNGLFLNELAVSKPRPLRPGDRIRLGPVSIEVLEVIPEAAPAEGNEREAATLGLSGEEAPPKPLGVEPLLSPLPPKSGKPSAPAPESPSEWDSVQDWSRRYEEAMAALRGDFERLWNAVKLRTPPTLAGEMGALHDNAWASMERMAGVAGGIEAACERLGRLLEAARIISAPQPLRERLETILDLAIRQMSADCGFLMLYSRRRRSLTLALQRGMANLKKEIRIEERTPPPGEPSASIARETAKSGTTVFRAPLAGAPEALGEPLGEALMAQGIHAAICAPMKVEGRFVGLIYVDFRDPEAAPSRAVGPDDARWLESLGSLAALAIENARLIQKSRKG
ncbi:MAG: FHA domain-containing protein [Candidatus Sumerlaeota bacterium]|nr:FHA domain-containing protein [Candidatus Sumerlaeota bacterium]